jgi:anti-sigma factor RsiW
VTRFVDGELPSALAATVGRHLAECPVCAGQAAFEIEAGDLLRSLPDMAPPPGLAGQIRALCRTASVSPN